MSRPQWLCGHPHRFLAVEKGQTIHPSHGNDPDFEIVRYHLYCIRCHKSLTTGCHRLSHDGRKKVFGKDGK